MTVNAASVENVVLLPGGSLLRLNKASLVYHAVRRAILLGELEPGRLLAEQHIAGDLGCSQGTVREALLRLQQDGLVARRGYRGTVVSDTSPAEAAQMAHIRIAIETDGVRRSAGRFRSADLDRLSGLIEEAEAASRAEDPYACSELDRQFHLTIFQASGLTALEPILTRCALHMHRYTFRFAASTRRQHESPVRDQHMEILQALRRGQPESAAQALSSHIEAVIAFWSPTLRRAMAESGAGLPCARAPTNGEAGAPAGGAVYPSGWEPSVG